MTDADLPEVDEQTLIQLEDYLDDRLSPEQSKAFEVRLANEPALQREYELQCEIDGVLGGFGSHGAERERQALAQLQTLAGETHAPALEDRDEDTEADPAPVPIPIAAARRALWHSPVIRLAAMIAVATLAGVVGWTVLQPSGSSSTGGYRTIQVVHVHQTFEDTLAAGFEPDWVCDRPRFTQTIDERLGSPLALASMPDDRRMLGLSYVARGRQSTVMMLGQADDQPVLVFFDRPNLIHPTHYDLTLPDGFYLHRQAYGERLEAIEISTRPEPVFLDYFELPVDERVE